MREVPVEGFSVIGKSISQYRIILSVKSAFQERQVLLLSLVMVVPWTVVSGGM
jgi:hypothetical protein